MILHECVGVINVNNRVWDPLTGVHGCVCVGECVCMSKFVRVHVCVRDGV
jgi:hypothetical protein